MTVDTLSKEAGVSRSKFITDIVKEKISNDENDKIQSMYNCVFSDESIAEEQLRFARDFESSGREDGRQW